MCRKTSEPAVRTLWAAAVQRNKCTCSPARSVPLRRQIKSCFIDRGPIGRFALRYIRYQNINTRCAVVILEKFFFFLTCLCSSMFNGWRDLSKLRPFFVTVASDLSRINPNDRPLTARLGSADVKSLPQSNVTVYEND